MEFSRGPACAGFASAISAASPGSNKKMKTLFRKLTMKGFQPKHVAEVGVYHPATSNVYDYIQRGVRCTLVEPDPRSVELIRQQFGKRKNVTLHPVAVYDFNGKVELVQREASTYVSELPVSPAIVNDGYRLDAKDKLVVETKTFNEIDDGAIDLLSVDVEGSEWFVIKHMVSRPSVISLETHGAIYVNPHLHEILAWMKANDYLLWYKGKRDSVFVKRGVLEIGAIEKVELAFMNAYLGARRARKTIWRAMRHEFGVSLTA